MRSMLLAKTNDLAARLFCIATTNVEQGPLGNPGSWYGFFVNPNDAQRIYTLFDIR